MSDDKWVSELKEIFKARLDLLCRETRAKFYPTYNLEGILASKNWFDSICALLKAPTPEGFVRLVPDHIDYTLEYLVMHNEDYRKLFEQKPDVLEACDFKLKNPEQVKQLAKETNKKY